METRETLEAALLSSWDRDTLAVYADHLQGEGDPRGELIALDLQIEAQGNNVELSKRRTSLLYAWLGALVPVDNVHAPWVGDSLKFGFVEDLEVTEPAPLERVLASAAGPYIRGLKLSGNTEPLEAALRVLARYEHNWLTRLSIGLVGGGAPIDPAVAQPAFAAMPRLETLELVQRPAFSPLSHPSIKRLVLDQLHAFAALGEGARFDKLEELEIRQWTYAPAYFDEDYVEEQPPEVELPHVEFPALRRLVLHDYSVAFDAALNLLRRLDARAHVTHLRIPVLKSKLDQDMLVATIRDMPALKVIEVAHGSHYDPTEIEGVELVRAERWPWPTQELANGRDVRITMPGAKYGDTIPLVDAVRVMEQRFERMPAAQREAWSQLWSFIATLKKLPGTFSARVLADAVEACPELMANGWRELREELSARRPLAANALVTIERASI